MCESLSRGVDARQEEMVRMWSLVPVPEGVLELGQLAVHQVSIEDALQSLTAEERVVVAEKQLLENTILPKAEQACGHALVAEAKVTPILVDLAETVGAGQHGL